MDTNYATEPKLDTKSPVGGHGIQKPQYGSGPTIATTTSAPTNNPGTNLNGSYNHANLSAKFKNPNVKQSVPEAGQGQYM